MIEVEKYVNKRARIVAGATGIEEDDIRQIASIVAWKAGRKEGVGPGYIIKAIEHKWIDVMRAAKRDGFNRCLSLEEVIGSGVEPSDGGEWQKETEFGMDCAMVSAALWRHSPELAIVFDLVYLYGYSGKELERFLDLSRRQIGIRIKELQKFVSELV